MLARVVPIAMVCTLAACGDCRGRQPPLAMPADAGPRWAQVVEWARPASPDPGSHVVLTRAAAELRPVREEVKRLLREGASDALPFIDRTGLPPEAARALASLVEWHQGGGGLGGRSCRQLDDTLDIHALGQLALAVSDSVEQPEVQAALELARRLRDDGPSILTVMVGASLADAAVSWSRERGAGPAPAFARLRPPPTFVQRSLAAEAVCSLELAALLRGPDGAAERESLARRRAVTGDAVTALVEREIAAVRQYQEDLVHGVRDRLGDPAALDAFLEERARAAHDQDDWLLLKVVVPPGAHLVEKLREHERNVTAFLDGRD